MAVALLAASCGGTAGGGAAPARIALAACTVQEVPARCGYLKVAENPAQPGGRQISLRVVVLPATTSDRKPDPLFYFEGGPGGAATLETAWAASHFGLFNQHHDIVLVDQRGTGASNQALCPTPALAVPTEAAVAAAVKACLDGVADRADVRYYTTPLSADDFDQVRAALGYDRVDVYGVSYGVSSGLAYVQRHGDHVRSAVFDSGSLLDFHIYEQLPRSAEQSLERLLERCRASTECNRAFPNLTAEFGSLVTRLSKEPVRTDIVDPTSGSDVVIDIKLFASIVLSGYLGSTQNAAHLPKDVHAAARGDWTAFVKTSLAMAEQYMPVMAVTVRCTDEWASHDAARTGATAPSSPFTPTEVQYASDMTVICKYWPQAEGASGRVKSDAPIVFLNSTGDPVDPPDNVAGVEADMPNSLVVPVAGLGHWQLDGDITRCLDDETATFFEAGRPSTLGLWRCAAAPVLPAFVT